VTEREFLAAEHALRLLQGEELLQARGLEASDPAFAAEVVAWQERLAPLLDEVAPVAPDPDLWARIEGAIGSERGGGEVVALRRKVRRWQGAAAVAAAATVALAIVATPVFLPRPTPAPAPEPQQQRPQPVLIASLGDEQTPGAIAVTFVPQARQLLVTTAAISDRTDRSHQLWLIPEGGTPVSLGLVDTGAPSRRIVPTELASRFRAGATIALSLEPEGGSPTGQPTGPVLAAGNLQAI
jgi:anti-sigma-K factor RskA